MIVNALLVCWNGGWFRLDDPAAISAAGYRAEGFLSLGAQYDEGEAYRQAQQVLADYRETRVGVETRIDPAPAGQGAAAPYQGWRPTNTISVAGRTHRVRSMRVQLTDDGPEFTPGFGRRAPSESDRLVTAVKKFSPGVMAGDTAIPTPMSPYSAGAAEEPQNDGRGCEHFSAMGVGGAQIEISYKTPVTVYVDAHVFGIVDGDDELWLAPSIAYKDPPPGAPPGYWQTYNMPYLVSSDGKVTGGITYSDTIAAGENEIGVWIPPFVEGVHGSDLWVAMNVTICEANNQSTVGWFWVSLG